MSSSIFCTNQKQCPEEPSALRIFHDPGFQGTFKILLVIPCPLPEVKVLKEGEGRHLPFGLIDSSEDSLFTLKKQSISSL